MDHRAHSLVKAKISYCLHCAAELDGPLLDLGSVPPCNRFETAPQADSPRFPLAVAKCPACAAVQLDPLPPVDDLRPRVPWISYNEPDLHMDAVVEALLPIIPQDVRSSLTVGPFDAPLAIRLARRGIESASVPLLDSFPPSGPSTFPYLETYQAKLRRSVTTALNPLPGRSHLVICRYLLEHSHDPVESVRALADLATADGLVVVEVPDSSKFLAARDYSFLWEEHVSYFTEDALMRLLTRAGCSLVALWRYPGRLEDALVAVVRPAVAIQRQPAIPPSVLGTSGAPDSFEAYAAAFPNVRAAYADALASARRSGRKVAVFGAGHQSIMFVNALQLEDEISIMVDDDPRKQGYFAPGTSIPIVSSMAMLADADLALCLLGVSPQAEAKVMEKCAGFSARGGRFFSLFPGSTLGTLVDHHRCG
jgi:C-methyltransferase C-terminal domain/Putative zinc binding domain/Methyltransferase domain